MELIELGHLPIGLQLGSEHPSARIKGNQNMTWSKPRNIQTWDLVSGEVLVLWASSLGAWALLYSHLLSSLRKQQSRIWPQPSNHWSHVVQMLRRSWVVVCDGQPWLTPSGRHVLPSSWQHTKSSRSWKSLPKFCYLVNGGTTVVSHQFISQSEVILPLLSTSSPRNWRFWFAVVKCMHGWSKLALLLALRELQVKLCGWAEWHGLLLLWRGTCICFLLYPLNWKTTSYHNSGHAWCQFSTAKFVQLMIQNWNDVLHSK